MSEDTKHTIRMMLLLAALTFIATYLGVQLASSSSSTSTPVPAPSPGTSPNALWRNESRPFPEQLASRKIPVTARAPRAVQRPSRAGARGGLPAFEVWRTNAGTIAVRMCEAGTSGGYRATVNKTYRGHWQFSYSTWRTVGGKGDPAMASPYEQDYRAWLLWKQRRWQPWPHCGKRGTL